MTARASKRSFEGELYVDAMPISWIRQGTLRQRPVFLFAHGAGAPMDSGFMEMVSRGLVDRGICVVRFNFPYMERAVREGKRRPPDGKPRLLGACAAMCSLVIEQLPKTQRQKPPLVVGGKSMGGRMMSMLVAGELGALPPRDGGAAPVATLPSRPGSPAAALVYFGYPLHPPGKPDSLRTAHLAAIRPPQLFISGTRDSLAQLPILQEALQALPNTSQLHLVEAGDHSLTTDRKDPSRGSEAWIDAAAHFILRHTRTRLDQK